MRHAPHTRAIGMLLVAAVALGVFTLTPVSAHFSQSPEHLGIHAWKQVIKQRADRRYVRQCRAGSALAWAYIASSDVSDIDFSTAGVAPQYNCAGGPIRAFKVTPTAGTYQVQIPGIKAATGGGERLVATLTPTDHRERMMSQDVHASDNYIEVDSFDPAGAKADTDFVIVVFRRP
jgi:hypothetical protein